MLRIAALSGTERCVELILKAGGNPDYMLCKAAGAGRENMVEFLIKAGANVNTGQVLSNAAASRSAECVKLLLDAGADVNITNDDSDSALSIAVGKSSVECVEVLVKAGADVNITDYMGDTVIFQDPATISPMLLECIKIVLREGIKINVRSSRGFEEPTALTYFSEYLEFYPHKSTTKANLEEEFAMLLFAAGDALDETKVKHIPHYLKPSAQVSLMSICRGAI